VGRAIHGRSPLTGRLPSRKRGSRSPNARAGSAALSLLAAGVLLVIVGRLFVGETFRLTTESMKPTLHAGDRVLVDRLAYDFGDPHRGDLIVFRAPGTGAVTLKRVVATGGDRVGIEDGVLHVNGQTVKEPYVDRRLVDSVYFGPVLVPTGNVFVMGDARLNSLDSRSFGPIRQNQIIGRVELRIWPPASIGDP
jgi:signal peptidase I